MLKKSIFCFLLSGFLASFSLSSFANNGVEYKNDFSTVSNSNQNYLSSYNAFKELFLNKLEKGGFKNFEELSAWLKEKVEGGNDFAKEYYDIALIMKEMTKSYYDLFSGTEKMTIENQLELLQLYSSYLMGLGRYLYPNFNYDVMLRLGIFESLGDLDGQQPSEGKAIFDKLQETADVSGDKSFTKLLTILICINQYLSQDLRSSKSDQTTSNNQNYTPTSVIFAIDFHAIDALKISLRNDFYLHNEDGRLPNGPIIYPEKSHFHSQKNNKYIEYMEKGRKTLSFKDFLYWTVGKAIDGSWYLVGKSMDIASSLDEKAKAKISYYNKFRSQSGYAQVTKLTLLTLIVAGIYKNIPADFGIRQQPIGRLDRGELNDGDVDDHNRGDNFDNNHDGCGDHVAVFNNQAGIMQQNVVVAAGAFNNQGVNSAAITRQDISEEEEEEEVERIDPVMQDIIDARRLISEIIKLNRNFNLSNRDTLLAAILQPEVIRERLGNNVPGHTKAKIDKIIIKGNENCAQ